MRQIDSCSSSGGKVTFYKFLRPMIHFLKNGSSISYPCSDFMTFPVCIKRFKLLKTVLAGILKWYFHFATYRINGEGWDNPEVTNKLLYPLRWENTINPAKILCSKIFDAVYQLKIKKQNLTATGFDSFFYKACFSKSPRTNHNQMIVAVKNCLYFS